MRPKELKRVLKSLYRSPKKRPLFVWGPPGCGKSAIVQQVCKELDITHLDIRLPYCEPGDIKFPIVVDGKLKWVNSMFPTDPEWKGIVTMEELPQSTPVVQSSTMQATLDRRVGDDIISPGAMFVACGNRVTDRAGAGRVLTPVLNRFIHVDLETSVEDWIDWATGNEVDYRVVSFIKFKPDLLHKFNPEENPREFPSHRSWEYASDALKAYEAAAKGTKKDDADNPTGCLQSMIQGCVGQGPAAELVGFLEICDAMERKYNIDEILVHPDRVNVPKLSEGPVLWALGSAIADRCRTKKKETVHAAMKYVIRMPLEFAVYAVRNVMRAGGGVNALSAPGANDFVTKHRSVILAD